MRSAAELSRKFRFVCFRLCRKRTPLRCACAFAETGGFREVDGRRDESQAPLRLLPALPKAHTLILKMLCICYK